MVCFDIIFRNDRKPREFYCTLFNHVKFTNEFPELYIILIRMRGTKSRNSSWRTLSAGACLKMTFL